MKQNRLASPNMDMVRKVLPAACVCCGGDIQVCWERGDGAGREMALAADVCPACWQANCTGLSIFLPDEERWCSVLGKQARCLETNSDQDPNLQKED